MTAALALAACRRAARVPPAPAPPAGAAGFGVSVALKRAEPVSAGFSAERHQLQWTAVRTDAGRRYPLYLAFPEKAGRHRSVVVLHDSGGLSDGVRAVVERLAGEGFIAAAPGLFGRPGPGGGPSSPGEASSGLEAAAAFLGGLKAADGRVAVLALGWSARALCTGRAPPPRALAAEAAGPCERENAALALPEGLDAEAALAAGAASSLWKSVLDALRAAKR